jgi:calnexin
VPSKAKKEDSKTDEEWAYIGEWAVEEPSVLKAIEGDKGLVVKNPAAHHAISAKFDKKIDNKGKTLVVEYEEILTNSLDGLECGGAYMKLLQDNKALHAEEFSNASPYIIMFGPDKCGATNKVGRAPWLLLSGKANTLPGSLYLQAQEPQNRPL